MIININPGLQEIPVLFVKATNLTIKRKHRELERVIKSETPAILTRDDKKVHILNTYHDLHARFGGQLFTPAPRYLLDFLTERQRLMQINALVDLYNYISLKYALALGAHDLDKVDGQVSLNITDGSEVFYPLGSTEPVPVQPGEYAYMDEREILCRLEVKQCEKTKVTTDTTDCFFIIQGNPATPMEYLHRATDELINLIAVYCNGEAHLTETRLLG